VELRPELRTYGTPTIGECDINSDSGRSSGVDASAVNSDDRRLITLDVYSCVGLVCIERDGRLNRARMARRAAAASTC